MSASAKPLGRPAYGSIPHLLGSRRGPADAGVNDGQHRICTQQLRSRRDCVVVLAKLDGSNVAAARLGDQIVALTRAGYPAETSPYPQHHLWAAWVREHARRFRWALSEGEWLSGEWLAQAHGTRYDLTGRSPFVAFDLWADGQRQPYAALLSRCQGHLSTAPVLHWGGPCAISDAMALQGAGRYGELDPCEGAVWRVETERKGRTVVDFLAKYVRPGKVDGAYLESVTGQGPVWNIDPAALLAEQPDGVTDDRQ